MLRTEGQFYSPKNIEPRNSDFTIICNPDSADEWQYAEIRYLDPLGLFQVEVDVLVGMMPRNFDNDLFDIQPPVLDLREKMLIPYPASHEHFLELGRAFSKISDETKKTQTPKLNMEGLPEINW